MADLDYLIQILVKLRDDASPQLAKLKAEIDGLKSSQDAEKATQDLGRGVEDLGKKADKTSTQQKKHREETEKTRRATDDAGRALKDATRAVDEHGKTHERSASGVESHIAALSDAGAALKKVRERTSETDEAAKDLELRMSKLRTSWSSFDQLLRSGELSKSNAKRGLKEYASEFSNISKELERGSKEWVQWGAQVDHVLKKLKNSDLASVGGLTGALGRKDVGSVFDILNAKVGDLGLRITGVASFMTGLFDLMKIGFSQQIITGIVSLAGSFVSLASAASQAGAAIAGAFVSGLGQAIPMLAIVAASVERFKSILEVVSVTGQAEKQHFYDPTEKQRTQLQNTSQLISSQQQLSNSYVQLYMAQQRVRDSQIALTEARVDAVRNIQNLSLAEKNARLEAEGANLSLAEARRQLLIAIQKGDSAGLQGAELAVRQAELSKQKSEMDVPRAERDARLARARGVSGAPSVISAERGVAGSKQAVVQAGQAAEAARRQEQITRLQQQARSSRETSSEAQLKFLKKSMSPTELGLANALIGIERELKSPDSPLKKITDYFVAPFTNAVTKIRSLLKNNVFLGVMNELAKSMGGGLGRLEKTAFGPKGTSFFETMAKDASSNVPIISQAIERIMKLFEDVAKAAGPAFHKLSEDWDKFWGRLDKKYEGAGLTNLEKFFNKSADYAEKFAHLIAAISGLFIAIGHDAAPQGLATVTSFSQTIEKATNWVKAHGPEVTNFFKETREVLSLIGKMLFGIGKLMIEVFSLSSVSAFNGFLQQILLPVLRLVVKVLGWVTKALLNVAKSIPGSSDVLIGIAAIAGGFAAIVKVSGPIMKTVSAIKALYAGMKVLSETGNIQTAWAAMAASFESAGKKAAVAAGEMDGLAASEAAVSGGGVILPAGVTAAETGAAAGARGGILGGAAGLLGKAALPLAGIGAATIFRSGGQETGSSGLPTGSTSLFGGQFDRYAGKEFGNLANLQIGKFVGGIFGTGNDESGSELKLRKFGNEVEKLKSKIGSLPTQKLESIQHEAESLARDPSLSKWSESLKSVSNNFNPAKVIIKEFAESARENFEKLSPAARGVAESFKSISVETGRIWQNIKGVLKENIESIRENLGLSSKQGKEALAQNFNDATKKIEESMDKGTMSTKIGMERIKKLVSQALSKYGVKPSEIEPSGNESTIINSGRGQHHRVMAAGGYIPATPGGKRAIVGEGGHDEVVLSTDPRYAGRSRALLGQYFARAPHMAAGGYVSPFHGSAITGRTDQGVDYNLTPGSPITAIGETLVKGIISNWYKGQPYIWGELLSGPDKGKDYYYAEQINRLAKVGSILRPGQPMAYYASSGTGLEAGWATAGGSTLAGATTGYREGQVTPAGSSFRSFITNLAHGKVIGGQSLTEIMAPIIKGGGAVGSVGQAALNIATKAANIFLSKQIGSSGVEPSGSIGSNWSGSWVNVMQQIAKAKHWSLAAWKSVVNAESGGNSNARNLSSGAYGLGQFLGSTLTEYAKYGATSSNPVNQIEAMAQYIADRYGNPSKAWEHEQNFRWYARGGIAGGNAPWGGKPVPIIAHEGERIMNPSQYGATARLAGMSAGGLDHYLGYDSSPRQSFAAGGIPRISGQYAQPTSGSGFVLPSLEIVNYTKSIQSISHIFKIINESFKELGHIGKDNSKYVNELIKFINAIKASNTIEKLKEGREFFKASRERSKVSSSYGHKAGVGITLGPGGELGIQEKQVAILGEEGKELNKEVGMNKGLINAVKRGLKDASKIHNASKRKTAIALLTVKYNELIVTQKELGEEMNTNIEARYQAEVQKIQTELTVANTAYQLASQEQSSAISSAQSFGNLGQVGGLEQQIRQSAESQLSTLAPILSEAESVGNTELAASIKQEMIGLRQTVTNTVVETISNAQTLIQRESGKAESYSQLNISKAKIQAQFQNFALAGEYEKTGLEERGRNLSSTRSQDQALLEKASREGDTAAVVTLTEEINKNTEETEANNLALKDNATVTREMVINQIQQIGQSRSGIYGAAKQGLELIGQTTGFTNVKGLLELAKGEKGILGSEREGYEKQASGIGLGVEGMSPSQILTYLASPEGMSKIAQLEKGQDKLQQENMYKLITALETNSTATLQNAEEIAKLNGQLNQPQSFSTTAWNSLRGAFFNGMGGLLPAYQSALPPGSQPLEMPVYGSTGPGAPVGRGTTIGSINLTHPVEKLDPQLFGEELSHHIATSPSM